MSPEPGWWVQKDGLQKELEFSPTPSNDDSSSAMNINTLNHIANFKLIKLNQPYYL